MTIEFRKLKVVSLESIGAFLDQGQEKDLFLPTNEQTHHLRRGDEVIVAVYEDRQGRPCSSMRLEKFASPDVSDLKVEQKVDLIIYFETDLGYKALINKKQSGVLYKNEVFRPLHYGEEVQGYIRKIRDDKKIDLILQAFGNKGSDDIAVRIIELLEDNNGFLAITDKTDPEAIYKMFGVSKKKFKMALGSIYKKKLVTIGDDGIRLTGK
jgi:predicted RNA-binding protein (virulence factor B family)